MLLKSSIFYIIICFFFLACAQVVAPTGGIKDTTPPSTLIISPENSTINFTSKTIEIEFDEFVRLNQLNDELIVSPPLANKITTKLKGKKLIIELNDTLKENTTYVLNFGNAIVDVNESNELESFQYVFSTGPLIDSLSVAGAIVDAFSLAPEKEVLVMLYDDLTNDSIPYLKLPTYISRADDQGKFKITNIAEGNYKLFALIDGNKNYLYDQPAEKIGFISELLSINKSIDSIKVHVFEEERSKQYVEKQAIKNNTLTLSFNEKLDSFTFAGIDTSLKSVLLSYQLNSARDSALFWWKEVDELKVRMEITDGIKFTDTIKFKIDSLPKKSQLKLETSLSKKHQYFRPISLKFNRPIQSIDTSFIQLLNSDSTAVNYSIKKDSSNQQVLSLSFKAEEDSTYEVAILPNAFIDIYNRTTDSISSKIQFDTPSDYGQLKVKVNTNISSIARLIQLTDANGKLLKEQNLEDFQTTFYHLKPGKYRLKLIVDENNNGKWDPGKYLKNKQAEKVILYDEDINLRSNWDQEIEWILK